MNLEQSCIQLSKSMRVLALCLSACTSGSLWSRNPYIRSSSTKKNLNALHQSIEHVIQDIISFNAQYAQAGIAVRAYSSYFECYAFLFDFNDGIKREEYDHRILIKDERVLFMFEKLQRQTNDILQCIRNQ